MVGAALIIVLAGLLLPISLLLLAVVFDLFVLAWAAVEVMRRDVWPRATHWAAAHQLAFHLPHMSHRHR